MMRFDPSPCIQLTLPLPLVQAFMHQSLAHAQNIRIEKQRKAEDLRTGLQQCVPFPHCSPNHHWPTQSSDPSIRN